MSQPPSGGDAAPPAPVAERIPLPLLPLLAPLSPRAAATSLVTAPRWAFLTMFILGLVTYAATLVFLMLWDQTLEERWVFPTPATARGEFVGVPAASPALGPEPQLRERSFGDVWRDWRTAPPGYIGPPETTLTLVLVLGTLAILALGWLNLPLNHRTGSAWSSYKRSLRAITGLVWPLALMTLIQGGLVTVIEHSRRRGDMWSYTGMYIEFWLFLLAGCLTCLLVVWITRAVYEPASEDSVQDPPMRCEGCGYDLTYKPEGGLCPECGLTIARSLDAESSRPDSEWARAPDWMSWHATIRSICFHPRLFYRSIRLRTTNEVESRFAIWNYILLGVATTVWMLAFCWLDWMLGGPSYGPDFDDPSEVAELCVVSSVSSLFGVALCWLGHRVLASFVFGLWLLRGALPDFGWVRKVIAYETSFLWVFGVFWGVLITTFIWDASWISNLLGTPRYVGVLGGMPLEVAVLFGGTALLVVMWFARYEIAYRAIRWSNY